MNQSNTASYSQQSSEFPSSHPATVFNYHPQQWNPQFWNPSQIHPAAAQMGYIPSMAHSHSKTRQRGKKQPTNSTTASSALPKPIGCSPSLLQSTSPAPTTSIPWTSGHALFAQSVHNPHQVAVPPTAYMELSHPLNQNRASHSATPLAYQVPVDMCPAKPSGSSSTTSSGIISTSKGPSQPRLIDDNTPKVIADMLLNAIAISPFDLEGDTRTPELFIDQFETYANLLQLTEEQKRVLFAGLAYQDDTSCFEALKFDTTYEDMKMNFINWVWRMYKDMLKQEPVKKPGMTRRLYKFFSKLILIK